jgi:hypothetical protein
LAVKISGINAQENYRKNLWSSIVIRKSVGNDFSVTGDFGYRSCDQFVRTSRTAFGRLVLEKTIFDFHSVGIGFALFGHYKSDWRMEYRPYLQYSYQRSLKTLQLGIRFRNEFRCLDAIAGPLNRTRLQISSRYNGFHQLFQPGIAAEGFFTPGKEHFIEQRYTISVFSRLNNRFTNQIFYTLQRQSKIELDQNILGIQLQIHLE